MAKEKGSPKSGPDKAAPEQIEQVVRRYYALLHEVEPDLAALDALIGAELEQVEHPNAVSPMGQRRGKAQLLADQSSGDVLTDQTFELLDLLVNGGRVAVRGRWSGVLREKAGPLSAGTRLVANVAAFLRVQDGVVVEHESFECYEPVRRSG